MKGSIELLYVGLRLVIGNTKVLTICSRQSIKSKIILERLKLA